MAYVPNRVRSYLLVSLQLVCLAGIFHKPMTPANGSKP